MKKPLVSNEVALILILTLIPLHLLASQWE
jgi:hypothetical protein